MQNESYQKETLEPLKPTNDSILSKRKRLDHASSDDSVDSDDNSADSLQKSHDSKMPHKERQKTKTHDHKKKKDKHRKSSKKIADQKHPHDTHKPSTIWIEETNFTPKDAYRVDVRSDPSNFSYDSLYTGDVTNYKRRFRNYCVGLGDDVVKFTDQRNQTSKRKKSDTVQSRYYQEKLSDSTDTVLMLSNEGGEKSGGATMKEFVLIESSGVVDEGSITTVSPESYLMKQAAEYNTRLLDEPHNVPLWLEFIKFQDEALVWGKLPLPVAQVDDSTTKSRESLRRQKAALNERKVAIYERALEKNPLSEELLVGHMELVQEVWDTERLVKHWKDIVFKQPNRSLLWLKYIEFCQSRFSFYRSSSVMKLYQKAIGTLSSILDRSLVSHKPEPDAESKLLVVFILYCHFLQHSGFVEKAIALFQALIEFNLCSPDTLFADQNIDKAKDRLNVFEAFWDEEVARVGEDGASGWRAWMESRASNSKEIKEQLGVIDMNEYKELFGREKNESHEHSIQSHDQLPESHDQIPESHDQIPKSHDQVTESHDNHSNDDAEPSDEETNLVKDIPCNIGWTKLETHRDTSHCLPGRLSTNEGEDDSSDVDHVVLFDDIAQCLFLIQDQRLKAVLVLECLRFLGAPVKTAPHLTTTFPDLVQMIISPEEVIKPTTVPVLLNTTTPCVLYQPCPAVFDLSRLYSTSFYDILCPGTQFVCSSLKKLTSNLFNQGLTLLKRLKIQPDLVSSMICSWLQYEMNSVTLSTPEVNVHNLQKLTINLLNSVTITDYAFIWDLMHQLEQFLTIQGKKKSSLLSKVFLKPFTVSPPPRGNLLYSVCLLFVESMLKVREQINCYSKHQPSDSLALFALVGLSRGEFNPTMLPMSGFDITSPQIAKATKYFQDLSSHILSSSRDATMSEMISCLGCSYYFSYLSQGFEASCELMKYFISSLNAKAMSSSYVEAMYILEVKLIQVYSLKNPIKPQILRDILHLALDRFPYHFWFLEAFIKSEQQSFITGQLRRYFNSSVQQNSNRLIPSVFAVMAEISRHHRLTGLVGEYLDEPTNSFLQRARSFFIRGVQSAGSPALWRLYLKFEVHRQSNRVYMPVVS